MSSSELHKGKVQELRFAEGLSLQDKIDILIGCNIEFDYIYIDDKDIESQEVIYTREGDRFFKVIEHFESCDEDLDLAEATLNEDGTIDFVCQFHNGGASFNEVFEECIKDIGTKIPLTEEQIENNRYAQNILENEGAGYAVSSYCDGSNFTDPETSRLWDKAAEAIRELENHLKE